MHRKQLRRLAGVMAAVSIGALAIAGPVGAANTRLVYIGNPGSTALTAAGYGVLDNYTATAAGRLTALDIEVRNDGGQSLVHASMYGGSSADAKAFNPLFPPPAGPALAAGQTFEAVIAPSGVTCTITPDKLGLDCDLGGFSGHSGKTVRVIIMAPAAGGTVTNWFSTYLNEGNTTGTNQDNFYGIGSYSTVAASCSGTNADASWFLGGSKVNLKTLDCGTGTTGNLSSRNALGSGGGLGTMAISGPVDCSVIGYTCFGDTVTASVLGGTAVPGGLQWEITWYGTNKISGAIHFLDTYNGKKGTYDVIPFTKKFQCSARLTTNCWVSISASKATDSPLWFKAIFITSSNGKGGGFV